MNNLVVRRKMNFKMGGNAIVIQKRFFSNQFLTDLLARMVTNGDFR